MTQQMSRGQVFMFLLLMLYFMSSAPPEDSGYPPQADRDRIMGQFRDELHESTKALEGEWEAGYGNVTGFRLSYEDACAGKNESEAGEKFKEDPKYSILPKEVSKAARASWETQNTHGGIFPLNITGSARGAFKRTGNFTAIRMEPPEYYKKLSEYKEIRREIDLNNGAVTQSSPFEEDSVQGVTEPPTFVRPGNISALEGPVKMSLSNWREPTAYNSTGVDLMIKLNDWGEHNEHAVSLSGVYNKGTGNLVATTRSAKFAGIYALPHLSLGPGAEFEGARQVYLERTNRTSAKDFEFGLVNQLLESAASCEYVAYLHFDTTSLNSTELSQIDKELENPIGRPHRAVPPLKVTSGVLYSPDCGIMMEIGEAEGPRNEVFAKHLRRTVISLAVLILLQVLLFINQMSATNTPSTLSRLAFWTVGIINMGDGVLSMVALLCSMIFTSMYLQFVVCAFFAFICSSIYEMKYNIMIYSSQANERPISWRTALQGTPIDEREESPEPAPIPQDEQTIAAQLYTRYFFGMLVFLFFGLNVTMWPRKQRQVLEYIALTFFNSYWVPQIYRNVIRGSRKSFKWHFMLGTSVVRLVYILYIFCLPNPFYHHTDYKFAGLLTGWVVVQLLLLFLQELLGPRFFLPEKYLPRTYNYHPVLTKGDLENGYNFESFVNDSSLKCKVDCAICMQTLEIPVIDNTATEEEDHGISASAKNLLAARSYMVTPCRHIFHTECLEGWMKYKLQCPVCRNSLPPL